MGRHKLYVREDLLDKAIEVFWQKGYGLTTVQDLERVTGVNKSGLYTEFTSKEELFLASLERYLTTRQGVELLTAEPLGWSNIERFLALGQTCPTGQRGCYSVNSMRDLAGLPDRGRELIAGSYAGMRKLILKNITAANPEMNPKALTEIVLTFFSGLCIEQNLYTDDRDFKKKVRDFLKPLAA